MFLLEIKKLLRNKLFLVLFLFLLIILTVDPFIVYFNAHKNPSYITTKGENPFQFWMLMNVSGLGQKVYNALFWFFPLLASTIFFFEYTSSMKELIISRSSKRNYILSKIASTFLFYFIFFVILLSYNSILTYALFPNELSYTKQYQYSVPKAETFAIIFYNISPKLMVLVFTLLNALTIALFAVFSISIQMIFKFKNFFVSLLTPIIFLYLLTFIFDSSEILMHFDIRLLIQPKLASVMVEPVTLYEYIFTFLIWILVDIGLIIISLNKNRDII